MKTFTMLISAAALATASAAVNATELQPIPVPSQFALTDTEQAFFMEHQRVLAEQHKAYTEHQATLARNAMEAQRKFAEQVIRAPMAPAPFARPDAAAPFTMPEFPESPKLSDLPAAPSIAGLDRESRHAEIRKYMEERRATMRKLLQEQREAVIQERDRYLEQRVLRRPQV